MKKVLFLLVLFSSLVFANERILLNVIKNVSIPNVQNTIENARILQQDLNTQNFTNFLQSWKKVEALYFAGDLNEDFLDTPRYIDIFNNLKEDLNSQMKMVIESKDDAKTALFKNSFKTINALEYMIFNDNEISKREKELSIVILNSMISHLEEIKTVYETYLLKPTKDEKWENALVINTLIASSYRLKEWRIGNPAGFSTKYKNDAKNSRAEYFLSQNSFEAIDSILDAQKEMIANEGYINLLNLAKDKNATNELEAVIAKIDEAKKELKSLPKDDFTNAKKLFDLASQIHDLYYITIIDKLGLKAEILDADGD